MQKINKVTNVTIYSDGGSRGNPGPSGIGALLIDDTGNTLAEISKYIGIATNNVAEYLAVLYGLQEAVYLRASNVRLKMDSELVSKQLKGEYKVKDPNLRIFFQLILNLFKCFDNIEIEHIPRDENSDADTLVNKAINLKALL